MTRFEREVILVVGKTGHGKTLWTRRHIMRKPRVMILDPMLEYEGVLFDDMRELLDYVQEHDVYQVRAEFAQDARWLASIAMASGKCEHPGTRPPHKKGCRDVTLVIDEAGRALPSRLNAEMQKGMEAIEDVIYRGRHRHVTFITTTQRASTLNIAARSQWTRLISFWQTESADVKWIQDQAGQALDLEGLEQLEYYDITPAGVRRKRINLAGRPSSDTEVEEARDSE